MTFQDPVDRCRRHAHLLGDLADRAAFLAERSTESSRAMDGPKAIRHGDFAASNGQLPDSA
jgi:hypothetical protein